MECQGISYDARKQSSWKSLIYLRKLSTSPITTHDNYDNFFGITNHHNSESVNKCQTYKMSHHVWTLGHSVKNFCSDCKWRGTINSRKRRTCERDQLQQEKDNLFVLVQTKSMNSQTQKHGLYMKASVVADNVKSER